MFCNKLAQEVIRDDNLVKEVQNLVNKVKTKFNQTFSESKGEINGYVANIKLKEYVTSMFKKAYDIPFAMKNVIKNELDKMLQEGVIFEVNHSNWASPIVPVFKKNGQVRICVDFKNTVNKAVYRDIYPLPKIQEVLSSLSGGKFFAILDFKGAYQQLRIEENCKELFTINTDWGLFRYNYLTYGISSAAPIFQSVMDRILKGLKSTICYLDDVLIHGNSLEECYDNLCAVLDRFVQHGVKVNIDKCVFFKKKVNYLGFIVSEEGISPAEDKILAVKNAPSPKDITQLRSYLGLLNFYSRFIPNMSTRLKPLYNLLEKNVNFFWTKDCQYCFEMSKTFLDDNKILAHYDPDKPLIVSCDASGYGVGACLSLIENGVEKPVQFLSATLSKAQRNYANIQREALAIIFAVTKFHKYIFGRKFTLITDHQPLKFIFDPNKNIPMLASARIQRWSIILSAYDYVIKYRKGSDLANVDALSRLPLSQVMITEVNHLNNISSVLENSPLMFTDVALETKQDKLLAKVLFLTTHGWPNEVGV